MALGVALIMIVGVALLGAACSLAAFLWAVRTGQFSPKQSEEGGWSIFDP
jgi:cbb3-type cytochrome oxidase maturation protein